MFDNFPKDKESLDVHKLIYLVQIDCDYCVDLFKKFGSSQNTCEDYYYDTQCAINALKRTVYMRK